MSEQSERLKEVLTNARSEVGKVIIGQNEVIDLSLICIFTGQHASSKVCGVAKTLLVRTLATCWDANFHASSSPRI